MYNHYKFKFLFEDLTHLHELFGQKSDFSVFRQLLKDMSLN